MTFSRAVYWSARREGKMLLRSRALWGSGFLLLASAWLPPLLLSLRGGSLGLGGFGDTFLLSVTLQGVLLPLLALLAGADLFASEWEAGTLVPVLTLPLPRQAVFLGKILGRAGLFTSLYLIAAGSAFLAVGAVNGFEGAGGALASSGFGLLLCLACGGLGVAVGLWGRDRLRAFSRALVAWVLLVFVVDAVLLSVLVLTTPGPPVEIGTHGYGELAPARTAKGEECPLDNPASPESTRSLMTDESRPSPFSTWLMALDPVDLHRFSILSTDASSRSRLLMALPDSAGPGAALPMGMGWLAWLCLPVWIGGRIFLRMDLKA